MTEALDLIESLLKNFPDLITKIILEYTNYGIWQTIKLTYYDYHDNYVDGFCYDNYIYLIMYNCYARYEGILRSRKKKTHYKIKNNKVIELDKLKYDL